MASVYKRLIRSFEPYRLQITIVILLGIVVAAIQPLSLKISQEIVDRLKAGVDPNQFRWVPLVLIPLFLVNGIAKYLYNTIRRIATERVLQKYRTEIFQKYLDFPISYLEKNRSGELMSKIQNDLVQVNTGIDTLFTVFKEPFTFVGLIGMAFYFDWKLALSVIIIAPPVVLLFSRSGKAVKKYSESNLVQYADLMGIVQESISGSRIVKVFNLKKTLLDKFLKAQENYLNILFKSIRVQEIATPAVEFLGAILMSLVFVYAAFRISSGSITLGDLLAFIFTLGLAQMPIKQLNIAFLKIKMAEAALDRIYAMLDLPSEDGFSTTKDFKIPFNTKLSFKDISLAYGDKQALTGINIEVAAGQCVAFVGPSGSGKSSLMHLLPRLIEPISGHIFIDEWDITDLPLNTLRSLISMVNQETFLFHDTIYENIKYGNPEATHEQILEAAEQANCTEFIRGAPMGFETMVGERGYSLSGGERQRIAIARAFLKKAPILILDEATSNLDSRSEVYVQDALEHLMKDKTTLIVTHRYSSLKQADYIYVIQDGKIHQKGTEASLLSQPGLFAELYQVRPISVVEESPSY